MLVLDDADIGRAARFAANNSFRNAGQVCVSTERIYVHDDIADEFVEALVREAKAMVVGDGLAEGTQIGPMVSARQRAHVQSQLKEAIADGAQLLTGGEVSEEDTSCSQRSSMASITTWTSPWKKPLAQSLRSFE